MTAPLYEVKNKFSEYVALAQKGEVIEVQKYGKSAVVIMDIEEYHRCKPKESHFAKWYREWRKKYENVLDDEYANILENNRKDAMFTRDENPFEDSDFSEEELNSEDEKTVLSA